MERIRGPFQGVCNIVRFNWHFYLLALSGVAALLLLAGILPRPYRPLPAVGGVLLAASALVSLLVSWYVYDCSGLYRMEWCGPCASGGRIVNVHAGFDETSGLLKMRYPDCELIVLDFYDPAKHTEVSIRRARRARPPFPGTRSFGSGAIPLAAAAADKIFITLAAHEIRSDIERIGFFSALNRALKPAGQIVVTEHLRDLPNFLAYTIGFFHFLPRAAWHDTFRAADLKIVEEKPINPFIATFVLEKDGTAH